MGRPGGVERRLLPDTEGHHRRGHERAGASVPRTAAVQHQRAVQRVRQILLRSAHPGRSQRSDLPQRAAEQGQGSEVGGDVARDGGQVHARGDQERTEEVVQPGQHSKRRRGVAQERRHPLMIADGGLLI